MNNANTPCQFRATACHSRIFLVSLYLSGDFDGWCSEGERGSLVHGEVHVRGVDGLFRYELEVLHQADKRLGTQGGACGRVQQDRFSGTNVRSFVTLTTTKLILLDSSIRKHVNHGLSHRNNLSNYSKRPGPAM